MTIPRRRFRSDFLDIADLPDQPPDLSGKKDPAGLAHRGQEISRRFAVHGSRFNHSPQRCFRIVVETFEAFPVFPFPLETCVVLVNSFRIPLLLALPAWVYRLLVRAVTLAPFFWISFPCLHFMCVQYLTKGGLPKSTPFFKVYPLL